MAYPAEGANPEILRWARVRAGYSIEDIADAFSKEPSVILAWEQGDAVPTYGQLETLAYRFYKRPIALFFFPVPPEEIEAGEQFRTLPDFEIERLQPDTRYAIREGLAMQHALIEISGDGNVAPRLVFRELQFSPDQPVDEAARSLRDFFDISITEQSSWKGAAAALEIWRSSIQEAGVFVFKRSFKQEDVSGFSLTHNEFPLIYINNSTAKTRQIFTLFHELAHLLLNSSGITKTDSRYIAALSGRNRSIEVFCNHFASEFLVPSEDFLLRFRQSEDPESASVRLADFYSVSREVILRKLLDLGMVDQSFYENMSQQWIDEYEEARAARPGGGDYYATKASYLGDTYMSLVFSKYHEGTISAVQLAEYLGVKAKNLEGLERQMLRRTAGS
jgi:Zn-dependent peptidase ImmA (M78 family)